MSENEKPLTYASVCVCVCVCGLCISVYTQTYVAVVYFAHIYALATTICCSFFFFQKRTLQRTNYFIENNECSNSNTTMYVSFSPSSTSIYLNAQSYLYSPFRH